MFTAFQLLLPAGNSAIKEISNSEKSSWQIRFCLWKKHLTDIILYTLILNKGGSLIERSKDQHVLFLSRGSCLAIK